MIQAKSNFIPGLLLIFLAGLKMKIENNMSIMHPRERPSNFIFHSLLRVVCTPTLFLKALNTHFLETTRWKTRRRFCFSGKHRQLWHYSMGFESSAVHSPFYHDDFFLQQMGNITGRIWKITPTFVFSLISSPPHFVYPLKFQSI